MLFWEQEEKAYFWFKVNTVKAHLKNEYITASEED